MTRDQRLRQLLTLRVVLIAWVHQPQAGPYRLMKEALAVGAQYEPPISVGDLNILWPRVSDLLGPLPRRLPRPAPREESE